MKRLLEKLGARRIALALLSGAILATAGAVWVGFAQRAALRAMLEIPAPDPMVVSQATALRKHIEHPHAFDPATYKELGTIAARLDARLEGSAEGRARDAGSEKAGDGSDKAGADKGAEKGGDRELGGAVRAELTSLREAVRDIAVREKMFVDLLAALNELEALPDRGRPDALAARQQLLQNRRAGYTRPAAPGAAANEPADEPAIVNRILLAIEGTLKTGDSVVKAGNDGERGLEALRKSLAELREAVDAGNREYTAQRFPQDRAFFFSRLKQTQIVQRLDEFLRGIDSFFEARGRALPLTDELINAQRGADKSLIAAEGRLHGWSVALLSLAGLLFLTAFAVLYSFGAVTTIIRAVAPAPQPGPRPEVPDTSRTMAAIDALRQQFENVQRLVHGADRASRESVTASKALEIAIDALEDASVAEPVERVGDQVLAEIRETLREAATGLREQGVNLSLAIAAGNRDPAVLLAACEQINVLIDEVEEVARTVHTPAASSRPALRSAAASAEIAARHAVERAMLAAATTQQEIGRLPEVIDEFKGALDKAGETLDRADQPARVSELPPEAAVATSEPKAPLANALSVVA